MPELLDELTPDFGLAEGLVLEVGELRYRALLQGDLSLRVVNEGTGKASKSLPALKNEQDRAAWEAASARLKTLSASLKNVLKQQGPRLQAALVSGKSWPLECSQRLFLAHPLLRVVGRSLIWSAHDGAGQATTSFRIAEDLSLVDVEDQPVELPTGGTISLWHPVMAQPGEAEAWRAYLADYELDPIVEQIDAPSAQPPAERLVDGKLLAPEGLVVPQAA